MSRSARQLVAVTSYMASRLSSLFRTRIMISDLQADYNIVTTEDRLYVSEASQTEAVVWDVPFESSSAPGSPWLEY